MYVCIERGGDHLASTYEHYPLHPPPTPTTLSDPQTRVRSCRRHGNSSSSCEQWRTSRTGLETWRAKWHQRTSAGTSSLSITSSRSMLYVSLSAVCLCLLSVSFFGSVSLFCPSCLSPCQTISFNSMKTHTYSFYLHHLPVYFRTHTSTPSFTPCSPPLYSFWKMISRLNRAGLMTSWLRCGGSVKPTTSRVTRLKTGAESLWQSETFKI